MPSTVVHAALAVLIAAGLLGSAFDRRALLVVVAAVAFADLDAVTGLVVQNTHRALFHTLVLPAGAAALVYYDTVGRDRSWLRSRYDEWGVRVAWTTIVCYVVAAIGLDLFTFGGVNVFYPFHDQFYVLNGELKLTESKGLVQTFVELRTEPEPSGGTSVEVDAGQRGSTEEVHVGSGVDPSPGPEPENVERRFPIVFRGWQLTLVLTGIVVGWGRLRLRENRLDGAAVARPTSDGDRE